MSPLNELPGAVRTSWHGFLETFEPLRPQLYLFCRHLTRSPWDAEDLAQDTLARAFVTLGQLGAPPPNPRAWLFRVASNLWTDRTRRAWREEPLRAETGEPGATSDPRLQNHFYDPELIAEVCGELGVPSRSNGYRWWLPAR